MVNARISGVDYYLPKGTLTNADLAQDFPEWSVDKIASKTGISVRHIAGKGENASDLAVAAAEHLIESAVVDRGSIDFLILCTQSPDFYMPSTASIVQSRLGLAVGIGAVDINLGCSGFIYGLGLAKGMIESGTASNVLLLTVDTYSKYLNPADKSVRTIFGDGAAATLVTAGDDKERLHGFAYGTDGKGAGALIVPKGGLRDGASISPKSGAAERGLESNGYDLYMDGPAIFNFTLNVVPDVLNRVLEKSDLELGDIDLFVFHQANAYMLEHLRKKLDIDDSKFFVYLEEVGNTVSSTIPIALAEAQRSGTMQPGMTVMILGFGVGLSWGGAIVEW